MPPGGLQALLPAGLGDLPAIARARAVIERDNGLGDALVRLLHHVRPELGGAAIGHQDLEVRVPMWKATTIRTASAAAQNGSQASWL